MRLLAIDPGNEESAVVLYDTTERLPLYFRKAPNADVALVLATTEATRLAVEMIASYGMPVGKEVFETCVWIGRFVEKWLQPRTYAWESSIEMVYRRDVKLHLCNSARAKDGNVRQALIDRYGGKEKALGKKKTPGPLYGMSGDCWAALGVAVTAAEAPG